MVDSVAMSYAGQTYTMMKKLEANEAALRADIQAILASLTRIEAMLDEILDRRQEPP
jgi:hypothetical protein